MSGIAGVLSSNNQNLIEKMLQKIEHRGDSPYQIWKGSNAALGAIGYTRLKENPGPVSTDRDGRAIVLDGRLTNQESILDMPEFHSVKGRRMLKYRSTDMRSSEPVFSAGWKVNSRLG